MHLNNQGGESSAVDVQGFLPRLIRNMKVGTTDPERLLPFQVIFVALILAFLTFVVLDLVELVLVPGWTGFQLRLAHLVRGFCATSGGMLFVWFIMHRKEVELIGLRDQFSTRLVEATAELKQLACVREQEERRLDAVLRSMGEGVVQFDEQGVIRSINPRLEDMLGLPKNYLQDKSAADFVARFASTQEHEGAVGLSEAIALGDGVYTEDAIFQHPSGEKLIVSWTVSPIYLEQNKIGVVLTLSDVTERRRLQSLLEQQREDFLAVLCHRLQTPILASQRTVALMLEQAFGPLGERQVEILGLLADNNQELQRLLEMLMDIYRYKNGTKELDRGSCHLSDILLHTLQDLSRRAEDRKIELILNNPESDLRLRCDRQEIEKLIQHLTENAIKYARSKVEILAQSADGDSEIALIVEDDGCGIAPEDVPNLFDRFYQMSTQGKYAPTTGTGLCLCAEIARAHGGSISCRSVQGKGTKFTVRIPLESHLTQQASS